MLKKLVDIRAEGVIFTYGFSPDGKTLVYTDITVPDKVHYARELVQLNFRDNNVVRTIGFGQGSTSVFSRDGRFLVGGTNKPGSIIWDVKQAKKALELKGPYWIADAKERLSSALPLSFSPDNKQLLAVTELGSTGYFVWDTTSGAYRWAGKADELPEPLAPRDPRWPVMTIGRAPHQAIAFAPAHGSFAYLLFEHGPSGYSRVLYDVAKDKLVPMKQPPDGIFGPEYKHDLRDISLPLKGADLWALRGEGVAGFSGPFFDLWRFRLSPAGDLVIVPKYPKSPVRVIAEADGTAIVVPTTAEQFSADLLKPGKVLLRLSEFQGARKSAVSFQLSPDGTALAGVWIDPPQAEKVKQGIQPPSWLIVWDLTALLEKERKHRPRTAPKDLDHWVAAKSGLAPSPEQTAKWFRSSLLFKDHYQANVSLTALTFYPEEAVPLLDKAMDAGQLALLRSLDFLEQFPSAEGRKLLQAVSEGKHGRDAAELAKISLKAIAPK